MTSTTTDVAVIGGGPAGSSVSTLLAKKGYRVQLFERESFPRFHIGESLIPHTWFVLDKLGMLQKMHDSHFTKKYSVQFVNQYGRISEPFDFVDHDSHESSQTWQVRRSEFDHMLLNNAREHGVDVHERTRVQDVLFDGDRAVGLRVQSAEGESRTVSARVVVDASGQQSMLMDRFKLREWDSYLKKAACWTYWKGAHRNPGKDGGAPLVLQTEGKRGWFWYIPLHDDITSVGVVADQDYLFKNRASKEFEDIYFEEVALCPGLQPLLKGATRCDIFRAQKEYSYRASKSGGNGWVMIGDAFGFLDPLYSSGVLLALTSGNLASEAIDAALQADDPSEQRLRKWEPKFVRGMERMRRLVLEYYEGLSFGKLVRRHPDRKGLITDVLIGNVFKDEVDELWPLIDDLRRTESMDEAAMGASA
jgi:flavin-dependent dehydrogenase